MVKVWRENVVIPTYEVGDAEKCPMFLEKRVYQGSCGAVYPYPIIEKISDCKVDKIYDACFLENDYIKIMVLPQLGGRIQMAYDKIRERHFIYYNHVIKPALVGLTGPWISGGIEFNWPQHHRPSTFLPIDFDIEEHENGSATIWVSERERMSHQKATAGFTLEPGSAYLKINVKLSNPNYFPQTFLWWANPAVFVNDYYQSVFPPDVNAVFDHGKRDVSTFPVATGTYYKVDYSSGVDISNYKNIPVPTSYMAVESEYDFVGGYENDTRAGVLHVASHHVSPGKKQWTWGNGDFGKAWDKNLTDEDGPYIELMTGVFTDNQPDFSWLHPFEEKQFVQYFMPYCEVGSVKNATKDFILNLEKHNKCVVLKIYSTGNFKECKIVVKNNDQIINVFNHDFTPLSCYIDNNLADEELYDNITVEVYDNENRIMIEWGRRFLYEREVPRSANPAQIPSSIQSIEELYLTGLHLEQYRHATYNPIDYYLEGLRREPENYRCNCAMGLLLLRRGEIEKSITYLNRAIETITDKNPNPYEGDAFYYLGIAYKFLEKYDLANKYLYKSCWNYLWQDAGYFALAQISTIKGDFVTALDHLNQAIARNYNNSLARGLKAYILRITNSNKFFEFCEESLNIDRFNFSVLFELYYNKNEVAYLNRFCSLIRNNIHNYHELAIDYINSGLYEQALKILEIADKETIDNNIMTEYYKFYCLNKLNIFNIVSLNGYLTRNKDYCFPNKLESLFILKAIENKVDIEHDYFIHYTIGNILYDKKRYDDALSYWLKAISVNESHSFSLRNLALAYFNKHNKKDIAVMFMERAFAEANNDERIFMELDQLYKRLKYPLEYRLNLYNQNLALIERRDDLVLEMASLLNQKGEYEKTIDILSRRKFHPWEGGEGKVVYQYHYACLEIAKKYFYLTDFEKASRYVSMCYIYPENFREGKLFGARENDFDYWLAEIYTKLERFDIAVKYFEKAITGTSEPSDAVFYNDQRPEKIFYKGKSLIKLGFVDKAYECFNNLLNYGLKHIDDEVKIDYFAVSLPDTLIWEDNLNLRNKEYCNLLIGLGYLGFNKLDKAKQYLSNCLDLNPFNLSAILHLNMINYEETIINN